MSPLKIAFFTTFIDMLGFGIIIPIQPFYVQSFGASPTLITILGATYSLMQFLFSTPIGRLSDRVGRKPVLIGCLSLIAGGYFLFAAATDLTTLFAARMLSGIGGASLGATQAIIADTTPPEERAKGMGLIGAAFGLGFTFGPALGGALGQISPTTPIVAAGVLALINLALIFFALPETLNRRETLSTPNDDPHGLPAPTTWKKLKGYPNVQALFIISFTFTFAFALMEQTIGLFIEAVWVTDPLINAEERVRQASALTAYFLIVVGVVATIVQGGLIGRLTRRFGEAHLAKVGIAFVTLTFALIPIAGWTGLYPLLLVLAICMATGTGILHPSRGSLLSRGVPTDQQGVALGFNHALSALGRVIGPAIAGVLFERSIDLPFWVAVGGMCVALLMSLKLRTPHHSPANQANQDELSPA